MAEIETDKVPLLADHRNVAYLPLIASLLSDKPPTSTHV